MNVAQRVRMRERRDAADRVAGRVAHERGVGLADRLARQRRDLRLVDAMRAARDHEHRRAGRAPEHERLRDLARPSQPSTAAASADVRAGTSYSTMRVATPAASSASCTRCADADSVRSVMGSATLELDVVEPERALALHHRADLDELGVRRRPAA